jgi:hypothetical protein
MFIEDGTTLQTHSSTHLHAACISTAQLAYSPRMPRLQNFVTLRLFYLTSQFLLSMAVKVSECLLTGVQ